MAAYLTHLAILWAVYALAALGLNLAIGGTGIVHLGYVGLMAIGAYAVALLTATAGWPFSAALLAGLLLAAVLNAGLGLLTRRLRGDALGIVLLGFNFTVYTVALNAAELTRGALGVADIPRPAAFATDGGYLLLAAGLLALAAAALWRVAHSRFGLVLGAVRDDELQARVLGKRTFRVKLLAMAAAGAVAGLSGGLYAGAIRFVDPASFFLHQLVFVLSVVFAGGLGSVRGMFAGAAVMVFLPEAVDALVTLPSAAVGAVRGMLFSALLLVVVLRRPKGLFGRVELPASYVERD